MKLFLTVLALAALTACSTVAGIGSDIKGAADWSKEKMTGEKVKL
jgi:predicted small secreted protein